MSNFISIAHDILDRTHDTPKYAIKYIGETALIARALSKFGGSCDQALEQIAQRCLEQLTRSNHLSHIDNIFEWRLLAMPYAALTHFGIVYAPFESVLDTLKDLRPRLSERRPYENCEDDFILAITGRGDFPDFTTIGWRSDCDKLYAFHNEETYHFTHRYFYATDFGLSTALSGGVKTQLLLLLADAVFRKNCDLASELGLCLLGEALSTAELGVVDALIDTLRPDYNALRECDDVTKRYHTQFVTFAYQARRENFPTVSPQSHQAIALTAFSRALKSKDVALIISTYEACRDILSNSSVERVVQNRLSEIETLARHKILFLREAACVKCDIADHIYQDVLVQIQNAFA